MLINKLLADNGYIFVKNSNPLYIQSLVNLGSKPIFVYIKNNERIVSIGISADREFGEYITRNKNYFNSNNYNVFNFDCLYIYEIKKVLSNVISHISGYVIPLRNEYFYFFND